MSVHNVSLGSVFSCPHLWQYLPVSAAPQFKQIFSFLSLECDTAVNLLKNNYEFFIDLKYIN